MKCPNCGAPIKGDQKFCNKCGFNLTTVDQKSESTNDTKKVPVSNETKTVDENSQSHKEVVQEKKTSPILGFFNNNPAVIFVFVLLSALIYCFNTDIGIIIFILGIFGILYLYSKNNKTAKEIELNKTLEGIIPLKSQKNNNLLLLEILAYGSNVIAVFKLPILDLTDIFKLADTDVFTSGIMSHFNDLFNNGNISLFKLGTLTSKLSSILSAYYKDYSTKEMTDVIRGLSELKWGIYIIIFCVFLAIISKFIKNYEIPIQLVSGVLPTLIYLFVYFKIKNGDSDYAIISTFLGSGFYLGLIASIVLVIISLIRLGKSKKA